ncbi:MAG: hypothetical protein JW836_02120 [Deltaproteobacteria bacterium]|nr:hypothetical protein [Deltaproteobacteria bacterium]
MAKILKFREGTESPPDNLITLKPWEFRSAGWESRHFIQMLRSQSATLEKHRKETWKKGTRLSQMPPHFKLTGSMAYTIQAIFTYRTNEEKMREVYYLAGLIDCMINRVTPLLRTDVIKDIYKKIMTLRAFLNMTWYSSFDQVLFPLDAVFFNEYEYRNRISEALSARELYHLIREGTDEMFDILALEYTFYTPARGT